MTKLDPILSGPRPRLREWRHLPIERLTRAERAMKFAETFLRVPDGMLVGQPLVLQPFQELFIRAVLDNKAGTRKAILSTARKNAKTATVAILVLIYLCGPESIVNARIVSGALSQEQAKHVYDYAVKMIEASPELSEILTVSKAKLTISYPLRGTEYRVLAAKGKTAHGGSPLVVILDEAGQIDGPRNDFFEALLTSQGAHKDPLQIWISTQGKTNGDLFNIEIDNASAAKDPRTVCHVYAAPESAGLCDESAWHAANPGLGALKNIEDVREAAAEATRDPSKENTFRWLHLNQRVNPYTPFVSRDIWQSCAGQPDPQAFISGEVYAGLDLSSHKSLTAFVMAARWQGAWHVRSLFWMPGDTILDRAKEDRAPYDVWAREGRIITPPGKVIALDWVARQLVETAAQVNLVSIAFDRWRIQSLITEVDRLGASLPLVEHGQGYRDMSPSIAALDEALTVGAVRHGGCPVLTMCAANSVVITDPAGNRKLDKSRSTGRIDGIIALAMAIGSASKEIQDRDDGPSIYAERGLLVV